jgi:hypothetical protein
MMHDIFQRLSSGRRLPAEGDLAKVPRHVTIHSQAD